MPSYVGKLSLMTFATNTFAAVLLVLAALGSAPTAQATTCIGLNHEDAVEQFEVAFEGRVTRIRRLSRELAEYHFRVRMAFKGISSRTARVLGAVDAGSVEIRQVPVFRVGRVYRVYASSAPQHPGRYQVLGCNPSRRVRAAIVMR